MAPDLAANGSRGSRAPIRTISVVAPVRNEGSNVDHFVGDLAAQDFRGELEVLVADGNSRTTRSSACAQRLGPPAST